MSYFTNFASEFNPYKIVFNRIHENMCTYVINDKTTLPLSLLKTTYIQELGHNGVTESHYHTGKLNHHIEVEFGNKVRFYMPADRSGYLLYNAKESQLFRNSS